MEAWKLREMERAHAVDSVIRELEREDIGSAKFSELARNFMVLLETGRPMKTSERLERIRNFLRGVAATDEELKFLIAALVIKLVAVPMKNYLDIPPSKQLLILKQAYKVEHATDDVELEEVARFEDSRRQNRN